MTPLITYKKATIEEFEDLYNVKCDVANIAWGGFTSAPDKVNFLSWFKAQLTSENRTIYMVYYDNKSCGFFYIDKIDEFTYELSSSGILSDFCGRGIGTYTVKKRLELIEELGGNTCITWIAEDNIASYKRFEKLGFLKTEEVEIRSLPMLGGEHKFYKWIKML